jgi:ABC-type multidrug transport system fused ATPase/permease subunit
MSGRITVGELVAFNAYLAQLAWPMIAFGWVTNLLERGLASWKRMLLVMETEPRYAMKTDAHASTRTWRVRRSKPALAGSLSSPSDVPYGEREVLNRLLVYGRKPDRPSRSSAAPDRASPRW